MFRRVVHRLAMLTAIVVTCGLFTPCKADLTLTTTAGLTAGDTFRFVFVTDGTTAATSTNITDYDNFVTSQADGATYNGTTITWQAIGSTASVDAITHLGVNPSISRVYLANGTQVATGDGTSAGGIWSQSLVAPITQDLVGSLLCVSVWTGPHSTGAGHSLVPLGGPIITGFETGGSGTIQWVSANFDEDHTPSPSLWNVRGPRSPGGDLGSRAVNLARGGIRQFGRAGAGMVP